MSASLHSFPVWELLGIRQTKKSCHLAEALFLFCSLVSLLVSVGFLVAMETYLWEKGFILAHRFRSSVYGFSPMCLAKHHITGITGQREQGQEEARDRVWLQRMCLRDPLPVSRSSKGAISWEWEAVRFNSQVGTSWSHLGSHGDCERLGKTLPECG